MPVNQRGSKSEVGLPENRLVTNPKKQNQLERSNSGKINRGTGKPGIGDGGPSKGKKIR